jgi:hypothetical protein
MTDFELVPKRRLYDNDAYLPQAIHMVQLLVPPFRSVICETACDWLQTIDVYEPAAKQGALKSLGSERLMAYLKSKRKLRAWDQDAIAHQVMQWVYALDPKQRERLGYRLLCSAKATEHMLRQYPESYAVASMEHIVQAIFKHQDETLIMLTGQYKTPKMPQDSPRTGTLQDIRLSGSGSGPSILSSPSMESIQGERRSVLQSTGHLDSVQQEEVLANWDAHERWFRLRQKNNPANP